MANDDLQEERIKDPHREGVNTSQDDLIGKAVQKAVDKLQSVIDTNSEVESLAISLNNKNRKEKQQLNSGSDKTFEDLLYGLTESVETVMEWLGERETNRGEFHTVKIEQDDGITCGDNDDLDDMLEKQKDVSVSEEDSEDDSDTEPYEDESSDTSENQDKKKKSKSSSRVKMSSSKFFECNECHKVLKTKWYLKVHMQTLHGDKGKNQRHVCDCGKSFGFANNLKRHMRTHLDDNDILKPAKCDCGKRFRNAAVLAIHKNTHLGIDDPAKKMFACPICAKNFTHISAMYAHKRIHEADIDKRRPHKCTVCGKSFTQSGVLKEHKLIHTGKFPFNCELCSKGFPTAIKLKRHMEAHKQGKTQFEKKNDPAKPHKCDNCGNRFSHPSNLRRHLRTNCAKAEKNVSETPCTSIKKRNYRDAEQSEDEESQGAWSDEEEEESDWDSEYKSNDESDDNKPSTSKLG